MDDKELREVFDLYTAFWKQFKNYKDIDIADNDRWAQFREDNEQLIKASSEFLQYFAVALGVATETLVEQVSRRANNGK